MQREPKHEVTYKKIYGALLIAVLVGLGTAAVLDVLDVPISRGRDASELYPPLLVAAGLLVAGWLWEHLKGRRSVY